MCINSRTDFALSQHAVMGLYCTFIPRTLVCMTVACDEQDMGFSFIPKWEGVPSKNWAC